MFLLMAVGFILYRIKMVDDHTTKQLTDVLIMVITPVLIVTSYIIPFDREMAGGLAISLGLAFVSHLIPIFLTKLIYEKTPPTRQRWSVLPLSTPTAGLWQSP